MHQGTERTAVPVEGGFEGGVEFIEFGQGSPGVISSEEAEDESGEGDGSDTSDGDELSGGEESASETEAEDGEEAELQEVGSVDSKQEVSHSPLRRSSGNLISEISISTDEADEDEVFGVVL